MTKKLLFVFDFDGTLVDTVHDIAEAMNHVLLRHGKETLPLKHYRSLVGGGTMNMVKKSIGAELAPFYQSIHKEFEEHYSLNPLKLCQPYPGIVRLLTTIVESGQSVAVLSNKSDALLKYMVDRVFHMVDFKMVAGLRDGRPAKPDPEALIDLVDKSEPDMAFMIGDSSIDIQTAKNAGIFSVGVSWGYRTISELENAGADRIFEDVDMLLHWATSMVNGSNDELHDKVGNLA